MHVELRLLAQEVMEIILLAPRIPGPARPAKDGLPIVGGRPIRLRIGPDIPVRFRIGPVLPALLEPVMFMRCVGIDLVDNDLEAKLMGARDQPVEILQRPEHRVDIAIVSDIIAIIIHGRGKERREPDRIHAERRDMVEPLYDARQVADAIAIRIEEAARIDLIDRRAFPPRGILRIRHAIGRFSLCGPLCGTLIHRHFPPGR